MSEKMIVSEWGVRREHDSDIISSWAQRIISIDEVPLAFRAEISDEKIFPYTLFIPENRGMFGIKSPSMVIQRLASGIKLVIRKENEVYVKTIDFAKLLYVEYGSSLLRCWANFYSVDTAIQIEFNLASAQLIKPLIDDIRKSYRSAKKSPVEYDQYEPFTYLSKTNYKIMYYSAIALFPEDKVVTNVYQPSEILKSLKFFNKTIYEKKSNPFILIGTPDEIIRFVDHNHGKSDEHSSYGGTFTYIPRKKVSRIECDKSGISGHCELHIEIDKSLDITSRFSTSTANIDEFISKMSKGKK